MGLACLARCCWEATDPRPAAGRRHPCLRACICWLAAPIPAGGGSRNMAEVDAARGTVFLNAAVVPRIRSLPLPQRSGSSSGDGSHEGEERVRAHHFLLVELRQQVVTAARDVWVGSQPADGPGNTPRWRVLREQPLLRTAFPCGSSAAEQAADLDADATAAGQWADAAAETAAALEAAAAAADDGSRYVCSIYRAHKGEWKPFVLQAPPAAQPLPE